jgi:hypothetical protein
LGLRCVLKTKKRVPRAPRPNARLTNAQSAGVRGICAMRSAFVADMHVSSRTRGATMARGLSDWLAEISFASARLRIKLPCSPARAGCRRCAA